MSTIEGKSILHPLNSQNNRKKVIVLWSVNGAGVQGELNYPDMAQSAAKALKQHIIILNRRYARFPMLLGMIFSNSLKGKGELLYRNTTDKLPVLKVSADTRSWLSSLNDMRLILEELISS